MNIRNYRRDFVYILQCISVGVYGTLVMLALVAQFA